MEVSLSHSCEEPVCAATQLPLFGNTTGELVKLLHRCKATDLAMECMRPGICFPGDLCRPDPDTLEPIGIAMALIAEA